MYLISVSFILSPLICASGSISLTAFISHCFLLLIIATSSAYAVTCTVLVLIWPVILVFLMTSRIWLIVRLIPTLMSNRDVSSPSTLTATFEPCNVIFSPAELTKLMKPYKYIITCTIMQTNRAGLHSASYYWDNNSDEGCTVCWENKTMFCLVSVYGLAI
uniref:Uncharacterized protein LOC114329910 n=1 Tax=Diabrotica virgifera virgifera TaxID=50390 RepID=A0A6P7FPU8_DIAVI